MTRIRRRFCWRMFGLIAAMMLLGPVIVQTAAAQNGGSGAQQQLLSKLPATFMGMLPCADCPGIQYQLNLNADHTFMSRMTYEERNTSFDDSGTWEINGSVLALKSKGGGTQKYAERDANTLRQLDGNGNAIDSKLNYDLKRAPAFKPLPNQTSHEMEFSDAPTFTVAGVTDWTAAGGHGSDAILRTSEALTRETLSLKADQAIKRTGSGATSTSLAAKEGASRHRVAGDDDERRGDAVAAVHEYAEAVHADPSEENYFAWGSELLLHRAIWQAKDVFEEGVREHPKSARLLTGLSSALFAGALYEDAAQRICEASDLNPADAEPYMFMGKIAAAAPSTLPCVDERLARFARLEPQNAYANYLYAMAIWKQHGPTLDAATQEQVRALLTKAVTLDAKCSDGYLQLGNLDASLKEYPAAIEAYKKAIEVTPALSEAHYRLAVAYQRIGDESSAQAEFRAHEEIERKQAAEVDRQRREIKQFVVVPGGKTDDTHSQ